MNDFIEVHLRDTTEPVMINLAHVTYIGRLHDGTAVIKYGYGKESYTCGVEELYEAIKNGSCNIQLRVMT